MAVGIIEHLEKQLKLKRFNVSYGGAISANAAKRLLPSEAGYSIPAGYYPVGMTYINTGNPVLVLDFLNLQYNSDQSTNYFLSVKNVTSSASSSSASATFDVLFAPEWMVEVIDADAPSKPSGDIMREPVFKVKYFTGSYTSLAQNGTKAFTRSDLGFFCPEGYEVFSLNCISAGSYRCSISDCDPFSPDRMLTIRNTYTSVQSSTARLGVVFVNRKFMQPDPRKGLIIWNNRPKGNSGDVYQSGVLVEIDSPAYKSYFASGSAISCGGFDHVRANRRIEMKGEFFNEETGGSFVYPRKVEVLAGGEDITFLDSTCYRFIIPEDWTNKQIILKVTFD